MCGNTLKTFLLLMQEIGSALDLEDAAPLGGDPRSTLWELTIAPGQTFQLTCLEEKQSLLLSTTLDEPFSDKHFKTLLLLNGLYEQTGGIRMGLEYPGGNIVMNFESPLDTLPLEQLRTVIFNLTSELVSWRGLIQSEPGEIDPPSVMPADQHGMRA